MNTTTQIQYLSLIKFGMEVSRPDREIRSARLPQIQLNKDIQNYTI